ncbi:hypothetical protein ZIOFF_070395 [Zingiber officinale]|uniref:Phospho-2-dehydro-3-deoxyheptonate aldolase n=1 Tax=Zingiber officinale TaxID=94328 RepID=A0A8J5CD14_ZINOF|nr:hypothetical protein ZIOFF_070395 [Zingiber officinale]
MGGDCAESFKEFNPDNIGDTFRILHQMAVVLMFGGQMPVLRVGRMAGQFAKPRSNPFEEKNGVKLPIRGDAQPSPGVCRRWLCCHATCNPVEPRFHLAQRAGHQELAHRVDEALGFMAAAGLTILTTTEFWTSHECLLLPYEQALTREYSTSGLFYDCSAHFLWAGEHTRHLDGAHVEFLCGVANPLGVKVSDKMDPKELVKLIEVMNPQNNPGRITIITRMGAEKLRVKLPHLIRAVRGAVAHCCHFQFPRCDPRLNASQSLELAFIVAERLRKRRIAAKSFKPRRQLDPLPSL